MFRSLLFVGFALFAPSVSAQPPSGVRLENATIISTSGAWRFDAGIILTWVRLDVMHAGVKTDVYVVALTHETPLPTAGATCTIEARPEHVIGSTCEGRIPSDPVLVASQVTCDGRDYFTNG